MNPSATCHSSSHTAFCFLLLFCLQETRSWTSTATRRSANLQPNFPQRQHLEEPKNLGQDLGTTSISQQSTHDSFKRCGLERIHCVHLHLQLHLSNYSSHQSHPKFDTAPAIHGCDSPHFLRNCSQRRVSSRRHTDFTL
jgi:hypothetical protein